MAFISFWCVKATQHWLAGGNKKGICVYNQVLQLLLLWEKESIYCIYQTEKYIEGLELKPVIHCRQNKNATRDVSEYLLRFQRYLCRLFFFFFFFLCSMRLLVQQHMGGKTHGRLSPGVYNTATSATFGRKDAMAYIILYITIYSTAYNILLDME